MNTEVMLHLQQILPNTDLLEQLCDFLKNFKKSQWVYPATIKRKLNVDMKTAYLILDVLAKNGFIESRYEVICAYCDTPSGHIYEVLNQLPETYFCEKCFRESSTFDSTVLIYKVVK